MVGGKENGDVRDSRDGTRLEAVEKAACFGWRDDSSATAKVSGVKGGQSKRG